MYTISQIKKLLLCLCLGMLLVQCDCGDSVGKDGTKNKGPYVKDNQGPNNKDNQGPQVKDGQDPNNKNNQGPQVKDGQDPDNKNNQGAQVKDGQDPDNKDNQGPQVKDDQDPNNKNDKDPDWKTINNIKDPYFKDLITQLKNGEKLDLNKPNGFGEFPLDLAIKETYDDDEIIQFLIKRGADMNLKDENGNTTLMRAISSTAYMSDDLFRKLLKLVADKDAKNNNGQTALMLAAREDYKKEKQLEILIKENADINQQDPSGATALHLAIRDTWSKASIVALFKSPKIDLTIKDNNGNLPFHSITKNRSIDTIERVELLVDKMKKHNVTIKPDDWKDNSGKTPWEHIDNSETRQKVKDMLQEVTTK